MWGWMCWGEGGDWEGGSHHCGGGCVAVGWGGGRMELGWVGGGKGTWWGLAMRQPQQCHTAARTAAAAAAAAAATACVYVPAAGSGMTVSHTETHSSVEK